MEQVFTTNWVFRQPSAPVQMGCETSRRQLQEGSSYFLFPGQPNLTQAKILDIACLIQYSVTETLKTFLMLRS